MGHNFKKKRTGYWAQCLQAIIWTFNEQKVLDELQNAYRKELLEMRTDANTLSQILLKIIQRLWDTGLRGSLRKLTKNEVNLSEVLFTYEIRQVIQVRDSI